MTQVKFANKYPVLHLSQFVEELLQLLHPVAHNTHSLLEFTYSEDVNQSVAQFLAVVSSNPDAHVVHVLIVPEQVAQFVLHTSQVLEDELYIVVPVGQVAFQVLSDLSKISGEFQSVQIVVFSLQNLQFDEQAVQMLFRSTYVFAVHDAKHLSP